MKRRLLSFPLATRSRRTCIISLALAILGERNLYSFQARTKASRRCYWCLSRTCDCFDRFCGGDASEPVSSRLRLERRSREAQIVIADWQRTKAFARGSKDRVRRRGGDRCRCRLAGAAPDFTAARQQMDVDLWRLRKTHHTIGVEVALHRSTVLDGDLAEQRGGQAKDHGALSLLGDDLRIDHVTGIE